MNPFSRLLQIFRFQKTLEERIRPLEVAHEIQQMKFDQAQAVQTELSHKLVAQQQKLEEIEQKLEQQQNDLQAFASQEDLAAKHLELINTTIEQQATLETLTARLNTLTPLLPPENQPFGLLYDAPLWLARAEERIGRAVNTLSPYEREAAFYSYYSEMGGDHRAILYRQYEEYLPWLQNACLHTGGRILDLGCGAGEFLHWLNEHGLPAAGIDLSASEVARAQVAGLDAIHANAVDYLNQTSERYAGITLFQVIEHLPSDQVTPLLKAAFQALRPGGVLLVETVNLRHALAFNGFYTDPTHRTPLSDNYLSFLFQWLGLTRVQLLYTLPEFTAGSLPHELTRHYHNYTVIGKRPEAPLPSA